MSHPEEGMFHALLDGELTPGEAHTIEAHVAACASCAARLADARAIFQESNALVDRLEMPERQSSDSAAAVVPLAPVKRLGTPQRLRTLAWAATVVIAAGAGYLAGDWRDRVPGQAQPITLNERLATPPDASAEGASSVIRSDEPERPQSPAVRGAVETETSRTVDQLRAGGGGEAEPAGRMADPANEPPANAAAPAIAPVAEAAAAPKDVVAGAPSRPAVVGGAQVQPRDAREDQILQEGAEQARQRGQDGFAQNRPPVGAFRARDSVSRQPVVPGLADDARPEAEFDNAKAAPASELRAQMTPPRPATLEEAVQALNGAIRLIEGASLSRVEMAAPPNVQWAAVRSSEVRVVYQLEGAEVVLSQVRVDPVVGERMARAAKRVAEAPAEGNAVPQLAAGDTLFASDTGGGFRVWWLDGPSRLLSLSGPLGQEALWRIVRRIR